MDREYYCPYCYSEIEAIGKECKMCGTYANKYEKKFYAYEDKFPYVNKDSILDGYTYYSEDGYEEVSFDEIPNKFTYIQID